MPQPAILVELLAPDWSSAYDGRVTGYPGAQGEERIE